VTLVLEIPRAPRRLALDVARYWDGAPCANARLHGRVELSLEAGGLAIAATLPHQPEPRIPTAPRGARVADLWRYDVVECFLVGADGRYVEVELGAGGHFLVLSFDGPRRRTDAHEGLRPALDFASDDHGWRARILLDRTLVPPELRAANAFVIAGEAHLAYAPVSGTTPDFHQPDDFPRARFL
jgi:hypothetical protein